MKNNYSHRIVIAAKLLLVLIVVFLLSRLFFYSYNYFIFADIPLPRLAGLFVAGIRFDLSVIFYFNLIYLAIFLFPVSNPLKISWIRLFLHLYFVVINGLLVLIDMSDAIFFHFTQKRSTADIIRFIFLSDDIKVLLPKFIVDYWFVPLFTILGLIILWKIYSAIVTDKKADVVNKPTIATAGIQSFLFLVILGLAILGGRGGWQLKPISIIAASKYATAESIPLVLNTPFSIMTTVMHRGVEPRHYFSEKEAENLYPVMHQYINKGKPTGKNVVVLLLESFSKEYVGYFNGYKGYTPFLDSLIPHALVFDNAYSNALRSIDAIPAIISGVPALMNEAFITSPYSTNKSISLAQILKSKGYYTAFFHGGNNGTMNFDGYASYAGFDKYYGRKEYNNDKDYDGTWGIYDEPFLQYVARTLNNTKQPFFAFEFTISSHYPYALPDKYKTRFKEGPLKIHKVISYSDYALKRFFETAATMPWYNNTLFILCADHPAQSVIPSDNGTYDKNNENLPLNKMAFYNNLTGKYAIPIILYEPGDSTMRGVIHQTAQQSDISPFILDYLHISTPMVAFGQSFNDTLNPQVAFQFYNGVYQIISGKWSLEFDGKKALALYNNQTDLEHKHNLITKKPYIARRNELIIKAVLQQYTTRLRTNRLSDTIVSEN